MLEAFETRAFSSEGIWVIRSYCSAPFEKVIEKKNMVCIKLKFEIIYETTSEKLIVTLKANFDRTKIFVANNIARPKCQALGKLEA